MSTASGGVGRAARRWGTARWRDPRLVVGLLLVLTSTVVGARLVATADDTTGYWAVARPVVEGDRVDADDLRVVQVRLPGPAATAYLRADEELPARLADLTWARSADEGLLVETGHVRRTGADSGVELPIGVSVGSFPDDLRRGDRVDLWVGPDPGTGGAASAERVLGSVRVLDAGGSSAAIGGELSRTVLVEVAPEDIDAVRMGALSSGHVTVVRVR